MYSATAPLIMSEMIARHWRGWVALQHAEAYESLLKSKVLPALESISGYCARTSCVPTVTNLRSL